MVESTMIIEAGAPYLDEWEKEFIHALGEQYSHVATGADRNINVVDGSRKYAIEVRTRDNDIHLAINSSQGSYHHQGLAGIFVFFLVLMFVGTIATWWFRPFMFIPGPFLLVVIIILLCSAAAGSGSSGPDNLLVIRKLALVAWAEVEHRIVLNTISPARSSVMSSMVTPRPTGPVLAPAEGRQVVPPAVQVTTVTIPEPAPEQVLYCPNCGMRRQPAARYCPGCGSQLF